MLNKNEEETKEIIKRLATAYLSVLNLKLSYHLMYLIPDFDLQFNFATCLLIIAHRECP